MGSLKSAEQSTHGPEGVLRSSIGGGWFLFSVNAHPGQVLLYVFTSLDIPGHQTVFLSCLIIESVAGCPCVLLPAHLLPAHPRPDKMTLNLNDLITRFYEMNSELREVNF